MKIQNPYDRKKARIEIIPLIDIVFFLLATFMMVSLSMIKNQGILINLPRAESALPQDRKDSKTITITRDGEYFLDKQKLSLDELFLQLKQIKEEEPDVKIFINGDAEVFYGKVVGLLDKVHQLGIHKVAIQTKGAQANQ